MSTRIVRRVITIMLLLVPLAVLWLLPPPVLSSAAAPITPITPASAPRWVDNASYASCSAAMIGTPVSNPTVTVDEAHAADIGAGVIASQTHLDSIAGRDIVSIGPTLVQRQFPDGQSRVAWLFGQGRVTDQSAMDATVAFVYVDASTGAPLLISGVNAGDPSFTCPDLFFVPVALSSDTGWFNTVLVISAVYLLVAGSGLMLGWRRQARKNRALPPPLQAA